MRVRLEGNGATDTLHGNESLSEGLLMVGKALKAMVFVAWVLVLASVLSTLTGCGPVSVAARKTVEMNVKKGPPCVIEVKADGKIVSTVEGPKKCNVEVD